MPYCEHCGAQVSDTSKFCRSCGAEQTNIQTVSHSVGPGILPPDGQILFRSDYTYEGLKKPLVNAIILMAGMALIWIFFEMMPYMGVSYSYSDLSEIRMFKKLLPIMFIVVLVLDLLDLVPKLIAVKSNYIAVTDSGVFGTGCVGFGITVSENFDLTFEKIIRVESKRRILAIYTEDKSYLCYIQKTVKAKKIISRYINDLAYE